MQALISQLNRLRPLEMPLQELFSLALRIWLFRVFFFSGLTKIKSWSTTLTLFEYEYSVPVIPPELAAVMATAGELALPLLLLLGLLGRFSAAGLFILNLVAVLSYPDISHAGIQQHMMWGVMLAYFVCFGPGRLSVDNFLYRRFSKH